MNNVAHTTPVKSDSSHGPNDDIPQQPFHTPGSVSSATSDSSAMVECLTGSFTGLKLDAHGGGASKRERFTVEGSPMVPIPFKQPNLNPTPFRSDSDWQSNSYAISYQDYDSGKSPSGMKSISEFDPASTVTEPDDLPIPPMRVTSPFAEEAPIVTVSEDKAETEAPKVEKPEKVLVICSASSEHNTGDHQENMLRTALLCGDQGCLRRPELAASIDWVNSDTIQPAPLCDLLRVHEYAYLSHLEQKSKAAAALQGQADIVQSTSQQQAAFPPFYAPPGMLDTDTPCLPQSFEAAKRFCGAAMLAVDHVMNDILEGHSKPTHSGSSQAVATGNTKMADSDCGGAGQNKHNKVFVIGRPPGHHAGPNGCVVSKHYWQRPDMTSSGFCLLNTVAVAAAYARYQYGRLASRNIALSGNSGSGMDETSLQFRAPRIAIVDIDIHHGNGTEEIVRNLSPHQVFLPLPSSWAPVSSLNYKPWLNEQDKDDVLFSSIHLYAGERFYPCSGQECSNSPSDPVINIELTPIGPGPWDVRARGKLSEKQREELCSAASKEFRSKVTSMLLPRIASFRPDLLFISAGFDAHYDDAYHFLTEQDIHWVTEQLSAVTMENGGHGVVSVLEGGYSLSSNVPAPPKAVRASKSSATLSSSSVAAAAPTAAASITRSAEKNTASGTAPGAVLSEAGRPVRGKTKKADSAAGGLSSPSSTTSAASTPVVVKQEPVSVPASVGGKHTIKAQITSAVVDPASDPHYKFAQNLGDGGLVKSVLAHVAALVNKQSWK